MNTPVFHKHINTIPSEKISVINDRFERIITKVNENFWRANDVFWDFYNKTSDHGFFVGSFGRRTAVKSSDLDILVELPDEEFHHVCSLSGNQQSRLLQIVKSTIELSWPRSQIKADGQVIQINFSDGIQFEILPAFRKNRDFYVYADTNNGGRWRSSYPKLEINRMKDKNDSSKGLLVDTCRYLRLLRDYLPVYISPSGITIDSFVYWEIENYHWIPENNQIESRESFYSYFTHLMERFYLYKYNKQIQAIDGWNFIPFDSEGLERLLDLAIKVNYNR